MLLHIPRILEAQELAQARTLLQQATWVDGRATSGEQAALAKNNEQLTEASEENRALQQLVLAGLERSPEFFAATLPKQISPPLANRYGGAYNTFGNHVDSAVRFLRNGAGRVRTDISCTLFLSESQDYEGGELVVEDTYGSHRVKLAAGDAVVYPGTSVHRVEPVTRGVRLACFFWVQSMVRSDEQRRLLYDMDLHLRQLRTRIGDTDPAVIGLTAAYHNLLRQWVDL